MGKFRPLQLQHKQREPSGSPLPNQVLSPWSSQPLPPPPPLRASLLLEKLPRAAGDVDSEAALQVGVTVTDDLQASIQACQRHGQMPGHEPPEDRWISSPSSPAVCSCSSLINSLLDRSVLGLCGSSTSACHLSETHTVGHCRDVP